MSTPATPPGAFQQPPGGSSATGSGGRTTPEKDAEHVATVEAAIVAVTALEQGAKTALAASNVAWAKANLAGVREILAEWNVNRARRGLAAPSGVAYPRWGALQQVATSLFNQEPRLSALAAKTAGSTPPPASTPPPGSAPPPPSVTPPGAPPPSVIYREVVKGSGRPPEIVTDAEEPSVFGKLVTWAQENPVTSIGIAAGAGYLIWRVWPKKEGA